MKNLTQLNFTIEHAQHIKTATEEAAKAAISLLAKNIQDDSLYLLFEWSSSANQLQIVVTDSTKSHDAPAIVLAAFHIDLANTSELTKTDTLEEQVKFWLHDYLSSYSEFLRYSLVAIFHASDRSKTELL